jgi:hypothetical protein
MVAATSLGACEAILTATVIVDAWHMESFVPIKKESRSPPDESN